MQERYKGRILDPRISELEDGTGWTGEIYIAEQSGADILDTQYILERKFPTEKEAIAAAIAAGKRKIDEKDIKSLIEEETQLPPTAHHGFAGQSDDFSMRSDGRPVRVPRLGNPEDRYK